MDTGTDHLRRLEQAVSLGIATAGIQGPLVFPDLPNHPAGKVAADARFRMPVAGHSVGPIRIDKRSTQVPIHCTCNIVRKLDAGALIVAFCQNAVVNIFIVTNEVTVNSKLVTNGFDLLHGFCVQFVHNKHSNRVPPSP